MTDENTNETVIFSNDTSTRINSYCFQGLNNDVAIFKVLIQTLFLLNYGPYISKELHSLQVVYSLSGINNIRTTRPMLLIV